MKTSLSAVAALLLAGLTAAPVLAQSRPDSLTLTCAQVQALIAGSHAMVIGSGPTIYDRFVSDGRACAPTQVARQTFIPTRDSRACLVYICRERTLFWEP